MFIITSERKYGMVKTYFFNNIAVWLLCAVTLLVMTPIKSSADIYENIIRIHVIANSDDSGDQALKLLVRDGIIEETSSFLSGCTSVERALEIFDEKKESIEKKAQDIVNKSGYDYPVQVCLTKEFYPMREYESIRLPAGEYMSLQVRIGEAQGQNWWCVLFPSLCLNSSSAKDDMISVGIKKESAELISGDRYVIRFKIVDVFYSVVNFFKNLF